MTAPEASGETSLRSDRRRPRAVRVAVGLTCSVAMLLVLEAGSYLFGTIEGRSIPIQVAPEQNILRYDHELFWRLEPDAVGFDGLVHTNAWGLRGPEIGPKADDEVRVLSLGESSTFGWRVPYDACYSAVLERRLAEDDGGPAVRVINAGIPGYTSFQGYQYLRRDGLELDPDVVVLYFGYNDQLPVAYLARGMDDADRFGGFTDRALYERRRRWRSRVDEFLTRTSNLYRLVHSLGDQPRAADVEIASRETISRMSEGDRRETLDAIAALCSEHDVELIVVVPWYRTYVGHVDELRAFAERADVGLLDLPKLFGAAESGEFMDPMHPTERGHARIADALYRLFTVRGL